MKDLQSLDLSQISDRVSLNASSLSKDDEVDNVVELVLGGPWVEYAGVHIGKLI